MSNTTQSKLELEGVVSLVEFKDGVEVARHPLDSKVVLDALIAALAGGLDKMATQSGIKWEPIPKYGDHMRMVDFITDVKSEMLTDDDGFGHYATATHVSDREVDLSAINKSFTHVVWYSK